MASKRAELKYADRLRQVEDKLKAITDEKDNRIEVLDNEVKALKRKEADSQRQMKSAECQMKTAEQRSAKMQSSIDDVVASMSPTNCSKCYHAQLFLTSVQSLRVRLLR